MEWQDFLSFLVFFVNKNTLFVLLLTILLLVLWLPNDGLPGPSLWQMLPGGEIHPILRDPRDTVRTLLSMQRKYGNVFVFWMGPRRTVVTTHTADVAQLVGSSNFIRATSVTSMFGSIVPNGLLTMSDDIHATARKKLKTNFNYSIVESCHRLLIDSIEELCSSVGAQAGQDKDGKPFDISLFLSSSTFRMIWNIAFGCGVSKEKREAAYRIVENLIAEMLKDLLGYPLRQALTPFGVRSKLFKYRNELHDICRELIRIRAQETPEESAARPTDAFDAILALGGDEKRVLSMTIEFAIAGSHTTSQSLAWCIYEICCNLEVEKRIIEAVDQINKPQSEWLTVKDVEGLDYLSKVWKESTRKHPPAAFILREAVAMTKLQGSGVTIEKGKYAIAFMKGVHNRADLWESPEEFRPERWDSGGEGESLPLGSYLPFGLGSISCIGKFLADHEGVFILAELYRRFRFRLACKPEEIVSCTTIVESPRFIGEGLEGVPVRVELR